jgi:hypothetical protein
MSYAVHVYRPEVRTQAAGHFGTRGPVHRVPEVRRSLFLVGRHRDALFELGLMASELATLPAPREVRQAGKWE